MKKKLGMYIMCVLALQAVTPIGAVSLRSYMPSVDFKNAMQRFENAKLRYQEALKSNKKTVIAVALAALMAATAYLMRARSQRAQEGQLRGDDQALHIEQSLDDQTRIEQLLNDPAGDIRTLIVLYDKILKDNSLYVTKADLIIFGDSAIAQKPENKKALATFFNGLNRNRYSDDGARQEAKELFGPPALPVGIGRMGLMGRGY